MGLKINTLVVECLKSNIGVKLTSREIAQWIFKNYRADCEEKRHGSKQNLTKDFDLIQQIAAEIAANRPAIQDKNQAVRTTETRPIAYYFSTETESEEVIKAENNTATNKTSLLQKSNLELTLYPLLASYLNSQHNVFAKRIDEKTSSNSRGPNGNKWLFPDLVGIEDFGHDWNDEIKKCVRESNDKRTRLWSFEVKVLLNRSNVRESWFQAVSNSSWANFGYLVASQIATDSIKELRILSAVHGIGVIRLDVDNPAESEILIPAKEKFEIDWDTCNRLVDENKDFKSFITLVRQFHQTSNLRPADWDIPDF
jgi:hypothetical protein